jgi:hypothetical protein
MNLHEWVTKLQNDSDKDYHETRQAVKEYWLDFAENIESESLREQVKQMAEEVGR